ncbi:MAG: hypothetical protein ACI4KA_00120 [Oscillospiraceae bacterium]
MKKRVLSIIAVVLICFNCMVLPVMASVSAIVISIGSYALSWVCGHLLEEIDSAAWSFVVSIFDKGKFNEADRLAILGVWDDVIGNSGIDETAFRALIGGITSEEYYWMFTDCNCSIDDICDYVFRTSSNSGVAFETVKTFVNDSNLSEEDLRAFHELVYVHRSDVYDFTSNTMRCGITIDDICDFCFNDNGEAVDNPDTSVNSDGYVQISGKTFSEICAQLREQYAPDDHGNHKVLSWRTDTYLNGITNYGNMLGFFQSGTFCNSSWSEVYLVPFYYDGTQYYYSSYQLHFYQTLNNDVLTMASTYWDMRENTAVSDPYLYTSYPLTDYRYMGLGWFNQYNGYCNNAANPNLVFHKTYYDYISYSGVYNVCYLGGIIDNNEYYTFYSSDQLSSITNTSLFGVNRMFSALSSPWSAKATDTSTVDIGYICSNEPINMYFQDIPVADDDVITLSGDNIYNYTITNTNGDTTTINNYIINNYTIPSNPTSDNPNDPGTSDDPSTPTNGNITVGGNVNVGGSIDVGGQFDINVNVNQGVGSSSEISGYDIEDVNLVEALEQIPELGDGFKGWFARMFDWLPPEILALLIGGIALAILLRIAGR